jgi:hypothetical protein
VIKTQLGPDNYLWKVRIVKKEEGICLGKGIDGECDFDNRTITLRSVPHKERFTLAVHEALHAELPDCNEDAILRIERQLVCLLEALKEKGYLL